MPNISNATVATGTGLSTAGNGGRKLVRLSNGTQFAVVKDGLNVRVYKSQDNWSTSVNVHTQSVPTSLQDACLETDGTRVFLLYSYANNTVSAKSLDSNGAVILALPIDQSQSAMGNVSLAINEAGTELHAAWSSKHSTYPNSFNIRYAKGTINGDGSVTWGVVEQVSTININGRNLTNPSVAVKDNIPYVFCGYAGGNGSAVSVYYKNGSWTSKDVFNGGSYTQANPSAIFVPTAINGLANGRLWVAWHGRDSVDSSVENIRISYSDDGGATWSAMKKLTTGVAHNRQDAMISVNNKNKVFVLYRQVTNGNQSLASTTDGVNWITTDNYMTGLNPSSISDTSIDFAVPLTVLSQLSSVNFHGTWFFINVSPASGALGNKETSTLTAYTVTPEDGSTVTQIVEKLNGVTLNTYSDPASLSRTFTVPQVNWDGITFWYSHTAEIIVTDSNGAVTTTTYTFVKGLADNAPLLEGVVATEDAYELISDKRDALAAQVGLSAGSTFDALYTNTQTIKNTLATNLTAKGQSSTGTETLTALVDKVANIVVGGRSAEGTIISSGPYTVSLDESSTTSAYMISISGLDFIPSAVIAYGTSHNAYAVFRKNMDVSPQAGRQEFMYGSNSGTHLKAIKSGVFIEVAGGIRLPTDQNGLVFTWKAYE